MKKSWQSLTCQGINLHHINQNYCCNACVCSCSHVLRFRRPKPKLLNNASDQIYIISYEIMKRLCDDQRTCTMMWCLLACLYPNWYNILCTQWIFWQHFSPFVFCSVYGSRHLSSVMAVRSTLVFHRQTLRVFKEVSNVFNNPPQGNELIRAHEWQAVTSKERRIEHTMWLPFFIMNSIWVCVVHNTWDA